MFTSEYCYLGDGYVKAVRWLTHKEILVLTYLTCIADENNLCRGSNVDISKGAKISKATVVKAMYKLQGLDCIRNVKENVWMINPCCMISDPKFYRSLKEAYLDLPKAEN